MRAWGHPNQSEEIEDAVLVSTHVARIEVQSDQLVIELTNAKSIGSKRSRSRNTLKVSWHKTPLRRRREILAPGSVPPQDARAIRSENRALLIASIARGRRWLNELIADPGANPERIATQDGCSVRKVNMTISLAFLAPDLVKAAIEGRLRWILAVLYQTAETLTHARMLRVRSKTPISHWTAGRFCNGCLGGGVGSMSQGLRVLVLYIAGVGGATITAFLK